MTVERLVRVVVAALKPDWLAADTAGKLDLPIPLWSGGEPLVGWLTYLSAGYPELPRLSEPAQVLPVGSQGSLVAAHSALYHRVTQRPEVDAVRDVLREAGSLATAWELALRVLMASP